MARPRIITLTTDFGRRDTYVGQMKGVILSIHPDAVIVDLSHDVRPGDIGTGAFLLETAFGTFPSGTIHVAVVDPGVGTSRRPIAVRTENHLFLAPDNGLLTRVLAREPARGAWVLEAAHYRRASEAATFEGRDVFAPAAAWIARGTEPSHFGPRIADVVRLPREAPRLETGRPAEVPVVHVDRFGNIVLDVTRSELSPFCDEATGLFRGRVAVGARTIATARRTYADEPAGDPFLLFGSSGYLEIAVRDGDASSLLGLAVRDRVEMVPGVV